MNLKISIFNIGGVIFNAALLVALYFVSIKYEEYIQLILFFIIISTILYSCVNTLYVSNLKRSLLDEMNIKGDDIFTHIYLWGMATYLPVIFVLLLYRYDNISTYSTGVVLLLYNTLNVLILKGRGSEKLILFSLLIAGFLGAFSLILFN